ncbi:MAG TPA: efflux RND transporter permease subunit [Candidatus Binataceae bacterium]|nr:efflux RND transporter permease subunit [Candidatus Binataceae bacterium]
MNLAETFIRRPVMTTLVSLAIIIFGLAAYRFLPVSDLPNVDFPTILVSANLPGASPETMASSVATPLERQFSTIAGLNQMTSSSTMGGTNITLQFDLTRNLDAAAQDVQSKIAAAQANLPHDMPSPPSYQKVNPADKAVLYIALSSTTLPLSRVDEYAETNLAERISMISGVAQVEVYGSQKYAVRIQLDPLAMASRGVGINEVADAVRNANVNLPVGNLYGKHEAFTVQSNGQLMDAAAYQPLIVAYRNGSPVRISDIGRAADSVQIDKIAGWVKQQRAIVLAIQRQPGTNTVEVVDNIKRLLPTIQAELPASVEMTILYDRSESIRASVSDVEFTLLLTIFLVVMVIFLFLRNLSATIIPSLALPMAIIGTFAVMWSLDYSLDNLSLLAITLSVGFVVDDAIVMLENIVRHMEMGKGVLEAALDGSGEIAFTILSMTLSLVAVFIPVLFMSGIIGRLLHEFAVTIAAAILVSGFVSLTLTPMLCSRFLKPPKEQHHGRIYQVTERGFDRMLDYYRASLTWVMTHRRFTMLVLLITIFGTGWGFSVIPKGFLPQEDTSQILMFTRGAEGISFDAMKAHQEVLNQMVANDPNVLTFFSHVGAAGASGTLNSGIIFVSLVPRSQRKYSVDEIVNQWMGKFNSIPGLIVFAQNPPPIQIGARFTESQYQLTLQSPDTNELFAASTKLVEKMQAVPGLRGVTSDLQIKNPQAFVEVNRDKASALGLTAQSIEQALSLAYSSSQISTIYTPNDEFWVIMELEPQYQGDPTALDRLYVRSSTNQLVPLSTVAKITRKLGPLSVNHSGQLPSVTISFDIMPGASLGDAIAKVRNLAATTLPASITYDFSGAAQAFQNSLGNLGMLLVMAILVIYLVLGVLYESFIHPITILSGLPAAGFGALLSLMIFHLELDLLAFVGIIMLIGLVKKNAIMMIDFALDAERAEGKSPADAIFEGCIIRFRPIMMTTMAAFMGTLPIAIGLGAGSDERRSLGIAVVGGLVFSQLLTLYITPVVYVYMDRFQHWVGSLWRRPTTTISGKAPPATPSIESRRPRIASSR